MTEHGHEFDPEVNAETVRWEWFRDKVWSSFEHDPSFRPEKINDKLKEFPGASLRSYRIEDGDKEAQGIWVLVGTAALIHERETPGSAKLLLCHRPLTRTEKETSAPDVQNPSAPEKMWNFYNPLVRRSTS